MPWQAGLPRRFPVRQKSGGGLKPLHPRQLAVELLHLKSDVVARDHAFERVHAVALRAPLRHFIRGVAEMHAGLAVDPLLLQTPMVDPRLMPMPFKMPVRQVRPLLAPLRRAAPADSVQSFVAAKPSAPSVRRVTIKCAWWFLSSLSLSGAWIAISTAIALPHERLAREILHQPFALLRRQFMRQGNFDFARQAARLSASPPAPRCSKADCDPAPMRARLSAS